MAICKEIELDNGVVVRYHRVVSLFVHTNVQNTVEVASYTSQEKREEEQEYYAQAAAGEDMGDKRIDAFIETSYLAVPYDQNMTIESAYEYLKSLPKFEGATDVPAGGGSDQARG